MYSAKGGADVLLSSGSKNCLLSQVNNPIRIPEPIKERLGRCEKQTNRQQKQKKKKKLGHDIVATHRH